MHIIIVQHVLANTTVRFSVQNRISLIQWMQSQKSSQNQLKLDQLLFWARSQRFIWKRNTIFDVLFL